MSHCPFWSNKKEKIECFKECAFYCDEENNIENEICPFKCSDSKASFRIKDFLGYDGESDISDSYESILW